MIVFHKLFVCLFFVGAFYSAAFAQSYSKCKIYATDEEFKTLINLGISVDHGSRKKNTHFVGDFSTFEIETMKQNGFKVDIIIEDVSKFYRERKSSSYRNENCSFNTTYKSPTVPEHFNLGSMAGFFTYEEYITQLDLMAILYPNLISIKDTINQFLSIQGRPIYYVKISDQVAMDENEPEVLYTSIHHAREPLSLSATLFYMWYLLENYETNDEIKFLVDETELFFVPLINPDGYIFNQTSEPNGGGMWRKNRRPNTNGTFGVDLNRNYSHGWGTTGISFNPNNDTYPGVSAFSEPETQAIKWFCEQRNFSFAFNAHTYSNLILFPFGTQTNVFAEDHDYFLEIGNHMTQYNQFLAQKASDLYPASGDSDDYMYADDLDIKPKIFAFTPEIGTDEDGFWPAQDRIIPLCQDMVFPNLILAHATHNYWIVKETDKSNIVSLQGFFSHEVTRIGSKNEPLELRIEPIRGIETIGLGKTYFLGLNEKSIGEIDYVLSPDLSFGEEIKYVLISKYGTIEHRDTIVKIFGNPSLVNSEDATTIENWTGNWAQTTEDYSSEQYSFTDSPFNTYPNASTLTFNYSPALHLEKAIAAKIEFNAKWSIENNYDYVAFEVSLDSGVTWIPQCGKFTNSGTDANGSVQPKGKPIYDGVQASWVTEEINLNDYLGKTIYVRFILKSDVAVRDDGFYFDDFKVFINDSVEKKEDNILTTYSKFNLFPNPSLDKIELALPFFVKTLDIDVIDLSGKIIIQHTETGNFNLTSLQINQLAPGSYFLKAKLNQQDIYVRKFIKL
jgi:carboxypeptidase T